MIQVLQSREAFQMLFMISIVFDSFSYRTLTVVNKLSDGYRKGDCRFQPIFFSFLVNATIVTDAVIRIKK
jgi:hypothetical protein